MTNYDRWRQAKKAAAIADRETLYGFLRRRRESKRVLRLADRQRSGSMRDAFEKKWLTSAKDFLLP
jgi:hypothetical protein